MKIEKVIEASEVYLSLVHSEGERELISDIVTELKYRVLKEPVNGHCPNCGNIIGRSAYYCKNCGQKVREK